MDGRLVACRKKHGSSTCVPFRYEEDLKLGRWVYNQRRVCKEKDRVDRLNDIGFEWEPSNDDWMKMCQRLVAYKKKQKSTRVLVTWKDDPQLGNWVKTQRQFCTDSYRCYQSFE